MRHEHNRPVVLFQSLKQDIFGSDIEVVGGLVEQQEVRRMEQQFSAAHNGFVPHPTAHRYA